MSMRMFLLFSVILLAAGCQSQPFPLNVVQDITDIFYNGITTIRSCSNTLILLQNINYILYSQENPQNGTILTSTNLNAINPNNRIIFIIHGWLQSGSESSTTQMKDAYLKHTPSNIIIVNWSNYADDFYGSAFCSVPQVGMLTGDFIFNLTTSLGIDLNNIQINGFSLGAQIAGYAGQQVQIKTNGGKIGRINGLDAAGPGYLDLPVNQRLDASDAVFVQGIHTSNWQFGFTPNYGTVDFHVHFGKFPGCGAIQPGCPFNPGVPRIDLFNMSEFLPYFFCNHVRASTYFIESIASKSFVGVQCDSCKKFGNNQCKAETTAVMGEHCLTTSTGVYYLNVNSFSPFAQ